MICGGPINKKPLAHWNVNNNLNPKKRNITATTEVVHKINDQVCLRYDLDDIMDAIATIHWHFVCVCVKTNNGTSTLCHWNCVWFYGIWLIVIIVNLSLWFIIHSDIVIGEVMINWQECNVILKCRWHFVGLVVWMPVKFDQYPLTKYNLKRWTKYEGKKLSSAHRFRGFDRTFRALVLSISIQMGFSICYNIQSTINQHDLFSSSHKSIMFFFSLSRKEKWRNVRYSKWSHCKLPHEFSRLRTSLMAIQFEILSK